MLCRYLQGLDCRGEPSVHCTREDQACDAFHRNSLLQSMAQNGLPTTLDPNHEYPLGWNMENIHQKITLSIANVSEYRGPWGTEPWQHVLCFPPDDVDIEEVTMNIPSPVLQSHRDNMAKQRKKLGPTWKADEDETKAAVDKDEGGITEEEVKEAIIKKYGPSLVYANILLAAARNMSLSGQR